MMWEIELCESRGENLREGEREEYIIMLYKLDKIHIYSTYLSYKYIPIYRPVLTINYTTNIIVKKKKKQLCNQCWNLSR